MNFENLTLDSKLATTKALSYSYVQPEPITFIKIKPSRHLGPVIMNVENLKMSIRLEVISLHQAKENRFYLCNCVIMSLCTYIVASTQTHYKSPYLRFYF